MNTFGHNYRVTTFGESHGPAIGGVIDGVPPREAIDVEALQRYVARRRPGQSALTTQRAEADEVEILSGLLDGVTLGTPIGYIIRNTGHHSGDYASIATSYRPNHADYTWERRYGIRDARGGGRASARETAARMVAGGIAAQVLSRRGVSIVAYASAIGGITCDAPYQSLDLSAIDSNDVRCPDSTVAAQMAEAIATARAEGDTLGGVVTLVACGVPAGVGNPVFGKLSAELAAAMMSIPAVKGVEIGDGFSLAAARGSEVVDKFVGDGQGRISTATNHSGGIQGGISNGADIVLHVAFKPVPTLMRPLETVDRDGNAITLEPRGRHDPCVVPRAVPVVEAMAAITLLDVMLTPNAPL
ncbi:MAG: chorismate synthase [Muribaculaceae bacterium]|nr:chorismate synthase [Muribaculaceae bacterium]